MKPKIDIAQEKEETVLTIEPDTSAICDKGWKHLYGALEPGEYVMGVIIRDKIFFKTRTLRSVHVELKIP